MPPISIQTALFVGEPVKNRETSELKEFVALIPMMTNMMPPLGSVRSLFWVQGAILSLTHWRA